jgi:dihydroorotate dehydrogenase electron transfer subunit
MKSQLAATVIGSERISEGIFRLTLQASEWARTAHAGHFVNLRVPDCSEILWRRPFSIHRADRQKGTIDLLFAAVGRGSKSLSLIEPGAEIDAIGLLGNTFQPPPDLEEAIIVAGGLGIAPFLLFLQDAQAQPYRTTVFFGAFSQPQLCCADEVKSLAGKTVLTTEDGSMGEKGLVTNALEIYLAQSSVRHKRMIFTCGPTPMLRRMRELALQYRVPAQVSVENLMACGFGACVGCPVEMAHPPNEGVKYWLACKDGPVFPLEEILVHG